MGVFVFTAIGALCGGILACMHKEPSGNTCPDLSMPHAPLYILIGGMVGSAIGGIYFLFI
jgi:hypothetical protein